MSTPSHTCTGAARMITISFRHKWLPTHASQKRHRCVEGDDVVVQNDQGPLPKSKKRRRQHAVCRDGSNIIPVCRALQSLQSLTYAGRVRVLVRIAAHSLIYFVYTPPPVFRCALDHIPFLRAPASELNWAFLFTLLLKMLIDIHTYISFISITEGDFHLGMKLTWVQHVFVHTQKIIKWETSQQYLQ